MTTADVISITRDDLYNRVWATPMRVLAVEFGVSDVGLERVSEEGSAIEAGRVM